MRIGIEAQRTHLSYNQRQSDVIAALRLPLMIAIVLLHTYTAASYIHFKPMYQYAVYPFALWFGESGVPTFLFISGFLFFHSSKSYINKLKNRFHSLVIPYLSWNLLLLLGYVMISLIIKPIEISGKSILSYSLTDYIKFFFYHNEWDWDNSTPLLSPFWYIRNLIILCVIAPALKCIIKFGKLFTILCLILLWFLDRSSALFTQSLAFFCVGAYFSINNINIVEFVVKNKWLIIISWAIFFCADIATHTIISTTYALWFHRSSLIMNIFIFILIGDNFGRRFQVLAKSSSGLSFWIYATHYPLIVPIRRFIVANTENVLDSLCIVLYFLCMAIGGGICIASYYFIRKISPKVVNLLTGNR